MTALSTWAASTEPKLARIINTFFLCHRSILLLFSPCYSFLTASPSPIPPFLTQQNKLETRSSDCCCCGDQEFGFFFLLPLLSCTARQGGVGWCGAGKSEKHEDMTEVKTNTTGSHFGWNVIEKDFISSTTMTESTSGTTLWASGSNSIIF